MHRAAALSVVVILLVQFVGALRVHPLVCEAGVHSSRVPKLSLSLQVATPAVEDASTVTEPPEIIPLGKLELPHSTDLPSSMRNKFSILSWNCLLPNSEDNWWCEKMYQSHVPEEARRWPHRQQLIRERVMLADSDLVCIQEAAGDTFETDFAFMHELGYEAVLHKKFRFRCATFYKPNVFALQSVAHEDRALVTSFVRPTTNSSPSGDANPRPLYVANVHLSGGASPDRRL